MKMDEDHWKELKGKTRSEVRRLSNLLSARDPKKFVDMKASEFLGLLTVPGVDLNDDACRAYAIIEMCFEQLHRKQKLNE